MKNIIYYCYWSVIFLWAVPDVDMIAKYAQMEFKYSEPERGRTMFENILSNYPKRCDLWSVYIDMLTKLGDLEPVR